MDDFHKIVIYSVEWMAGRKTNYSLLPLDEDVKTEDMPIETASELFVVEQTSKK